MVSPELAAKWSYPAQIERFKLATASGMARASPIENDGVEEMRKQYHYRPRDNRSSNVIQELRPHSCRHCRRLVIDPTGTQTRDMTGWFVHPKHINFPDFKHSDLTAAVEDGCGFCKKIMEQVTIPDDEALDNLTVFLYFGAGYAGEFDISCVTGYGIWDFDRPWTKWWNSKQQEGGLDVYARPENCASAFITNRPINQVPSSTQTFELARSWFRECKQRHKYCQQRTASFLPTRLIKIQEYNNNYQLRLYYPDPKDQLEYATLSYCWGGAQAAQTTNANAEDRATSLSFQSLPQTIQDAVCVTSRLGISYIWIDSLCIIQDSEADKDVEIARMVKIYMSASLTLATSRAFHADEGFLHNRKVIEDLDSMFELPVRLPGSNELGSIILFDMADENSDDRLVNRAWALQERLHSPRILDFTGSQLHWSCRTIRSRYTDGWSPRPRSWQTIDKMRGDIFDMEEQLRDSDAKVNYSHNFETMNKFWEGLVREYTEKELTYMTDRILAISGTAERLAGVFRDTYAAGLWRSSLPMSLLWSMRNRSKRLPRPENYQGPSWSWTSVDGAVHFFECKGIVRGPSDFRILDIMIDPKIPTTPFGAIRSACMVVQARAREARWMRNHGIGFDGSLSKQGPENDSLRLRDVDGNEGAVAAEIYVDALEKEFEADKEWLDVVLVELGWPAYNPDGWEGARGLVLRELGKGLYSRVGIFAFRYVRVNWVKKEDVNENPPKSPGLGPFQFTPQGRQSRNIPAMVADNSKRKGRFDQDILKKDDGSDKVGNGENDGVEEGENGEEEQDERREQERKEEVKVHDDKVQDISSNPSPLGPDEKPSAEASKQDEELAAERELKAEIWEEQRNFFDEGEHRIFLIV